MGDESRDEREKEKGRRDSFDFIPRVNKSERMEKGGVRDIAYSSQHDRYVQDAQRWVVISGRTTDECIAFGR
jgi:hypothetical protein